MEHPPAMAIEVLRGQLNDKHSHDDLPMSLLFSMLEHVPAGIAVVDGHEFRVQHANDHLHALLDEPYRSTGIAGLRLTDFIPDAQEIGLNLLVGQVSRSGRTASRKAMRLDGFSRGTTYWDITVASLASHTTRHPAVMLQIVDTTGAVLVREERDRLLRLAEQFEQLKDDFLAVTAHELRTPVTALLGYTDLMVRRAEQSDWTDRDRHALRMIQSQAQHLTQLINGLIDASRVQAGTLELHCRQVEVVPLAQQVVAAVQANGSEHPITVEVPDDPVHVWGDPQRLDQALSQLIGNALKYSPWGGSVRVRVWIDSEAHIAVTDGGIGIPEESLPQVFQRFYRATNVDSDRISGLGIGLYLVQAIIVAHGGRIDIQSAPNQGTTFEIMLPLYSSSE